MYTQNTFRLAGMIITLRSSASLNMRGINSLYRSVIGLLNNSSILVNSTITCHPS